LQHGNNPRPLGRGRELGIEAKVCELSDQALGLHVLGATIEMVGTEILKLRAANAEDCALKQLPFFAFGRLGALNQQS
jgi:hypothetical protein